MDRDHHILPISISDKCRNHVLFYKYGSILYQADESMVRHQRAAHPHLHIFARTSDDDQLIPLRTLHAHWLSIILCIR